MMSFLSLNSLTPLQALLFSADDALALGPGLGGNDLSLTTNGVTTTLAALGTSFSFPALSFYQAGNAGHISLLDGTHLFPGTTGSDSFTGSATDDRFYGDGGNDYVRAGTGNDYAFGGGGSDTIDGGEGNDHLYGSGPAGGADGGDSISAGAGNDYVQGNAGDDWIDGGEGNDRIFGGQDRDTIFGGAGNDQINGNFGDDVIHGGEGDDIVRGGKGADVVTGDGGNDMIYGDLGADTLTGGAGADQFRFAANDAPLLSTSTLIGDLDRITDFTHGEDHIALAFAPTALVYGALNGTLTSLLTYAQQLLDGHVGGGEVAAVSVGNDTYLFFSGTGGLIGDSVIDLQGVTNTSMSLADFI